jgi:hypothetical protein
VDRDRLELLVAEHVRLGARPADDALDRLVDVARKGTLTVPRIALRYRLQRDTHGLDLSRHRARLLTRELARSADLVLAMSGQQRDRAAALGAGERAHTLGEFAGASGAGADVPDPFGADLDAYRVTFRQLETLVDAVAARIAAGRPGEPR